ncbi:MAG: hypothetical protein JNM18_19465 [Planctomycetaceae bacterium]|nr:hypothetical protein [Planctomycetaceae bacterium]
MPSQPPPIESPPRPTLSAVTVRWQYRPWVDAPWLVGGLILLAVLTRFVILRETQRELDAALAAALMLLAGWRSLMPTKFEAGPAGFKVDTLLRRKRIAWRDIERIEVGRAGVFLIPPGSSWGWWRGLYIPWINRRDDVLAMVRQCGPRLISSDAPDLT